MSKIDRRSPQNIKIYLMVLLIILVSGCASKMALSTNTKQLNIDKKSVAIFRLRISNQYKPSFQPKVYKVRAIRLKESKIKTFKTNKPYAKAKKQYNEYLISLDLKPGRYKVGDVLGGASVPLLISAHFQFSLDAEFNVKSNEITYIGYIEMVNRKRKKGEKRSGSLIPLIDQAVTGFSTGTFDIKISDNYDEDIKIFKEKFPLINGYAINKYIAVKKIHTAENVK